LFPLNFRHLADRMFFARCGKQDNGERNSDGAAANETSHNALAQLSVSGEARKDESASVEEASEGERRQKVGTDQRSTKN
jgi:hypothetical protein